MFLISLIALYVITNTFFGIINQDLNSHMFLAQINLQSSTAISLWLSKKILFSIMQYLTIFNCQYTQLPIENPNQKQ